MFLLCLSFNEVPATELIEDVPENTEKEADK